MDDALLAALAEGRPLVSITGPTGIGRTSALARVGETLAGRGVRVLAIRFTRDSDIVPMHLACADSRFTPLGPVAGAHRQPEVARRAAAAAAAVLLRGGREAALLIDDVQWIDRDSRAVLEALVRRLAGTSAVCVCATRTPTSDEHLGRLRNLRGAGLVQPVRLRPMTAGEIAAKLAAVTRVTPDDELVARVGELSRGIPAAVRDSTEMLLRAGSLRVVGDRAYLVPGSGPVDPPRDGEFVRVIRALGPRAVSAATAACVFGPLGEAVPRLVAEALEVTEPDVVAVLDSLRREGILHRSKDSWRVTVPLVASVLKAGMGPFERRQLAATAVNAVWAGEARCADSGHLADLVADAGSLVERERALGTLLDCSAEPGERALGRLGAAIELTRGRAQRVQVMLAHTSMCHALGDHERGLRGARLLLNDFADQLTPEAVQELQVIVVCALKDAGDEDALRKIAEQPHGWPGDPAQRTGTRALAYSMLDRWDEARELLAKAGEQDALPELWPGHSGQLVDNGESRSLCDRVLLAAMRGEADSAVALARRGIAQGAIRSYEIGFAPMHQTVVAVLVAQGRLTAAREMLAGAREATPRLGHLLDLAEAQLLGALGENEQAKDKLRDCLRGAAGRGVLVGTELCQAELADLALQDGDREEAGRCLAAIECLAETMPTPRVVLYAGLVRAMVHGDRAAAGECLRLVAERGQSFEIAMVSERLVRHGVGDPGLLSEAYERLDGLGASLFRAWFRKLMREHAVLVPGRARTVAENERLLAMLVADGLTNRQLAMALRTSEKSIENQLSRLFARTGYRSRIELSAAMREGGPVSKRA